MEENKLLKNKINELNSQILQYFLFREEKNMSNPDVIQMKEKMRTMEIKSKSIEESVEEKEKKDKRGNKKWKKDKKEEKEKEKKEKKEKVEEQPKKAVVKSSGAKNLKDLFS